MTSEIRRGGRRGNVEVKNVMSPEEEFIARASQDVRTVDRLTGGDSDATMIHTRPGTVQMWKPGADGRYTPRDVSSTARAVNLQNGWKIKCPDCDTNHEASIYPPSDPNSCPGRDPVAVRVCPICNKRIFDNMAREAEETPEYDPNVIADEFDVTSTPASRTAGQLLLHFWLRHPQQAMVRGLQQLPASMQPMLQTSRPI